MSLCCHFILPLLLEKSRLSEDSIILGKIHTKFESQLKCTKIRAIHSKKLLHEKNIYAQYI